MSNPTDLDMFKLVVCYLSFYEELLKTAHRRANSTDIKKAWVAGSLGELS